MASRFRLHRLTGLQKCVTCWARDPQRSYVTCPAAWDGPVEQYDEPVRRVYAHDDVIICDRCVADMAFTLPEVADRAAHAEGKVVELASQLERARDYASKLEGAVAAKPAARPQPKTRKQAA